MSRFGELVRSVLLLRSITAIIAGAIFFGAYLCSPVLFIGLLIVLFGMLLAREWLPLCLRISKKLLLLTPLYPVSSMLMLCHLALQQGHWSVGLYPYLLAWSADTGAYLFGITIGKHKICPRISPGKSWEGLLGSCVIAFLLNYYFSLQHGSLVYGWSLYMLVALSITSALLCFAGDIFVSYLKRRGQLKDTGSLLPGHGGLLDRFDSVFCIVVFIWWWAQVAR